MSGEMSHKATCMTGVKNPAERFGQVVGRIENTFDMMKGNMAFLLPILYGKMLYFEMTDSVCRMIVVDDLDGGFIVFKEWGR